MRRDDQIAFDLVRDDHLAVHQRLESWAQWVKVRPFGWQASPMFRQVKSNSFQWYAPEPRIDHNVPEALEVEKTVSLLPHKEREAVRWCYVRPTHIPPEVWQTTPVDGEKAIQAMRAMCRGQ